MNKTIIRLLVIGMVFLYVTPAFSQAYRIEQAIKDENYKRALKLAEDAEEDQKLRKDPEIYFLKAQAIYELMKDEFYFSKNPDIFDIGMKSLAKGKTKAEGKIVEGYYDLVADYVDINNMLGDKEFKINKYGKARRTYLKGYSLNSDTIAYFRAAKSAMYQGDTAIAEEEYMKLIDWTNEKNIQGKKSPEELVGTYLHFADKYWRKAKYDSANYFLEHGRKVFGAEPRLDFYQKEVTKEQINGLPPSSLMMEILKKNIAYFPLDTFLMRKQNALYLYQIRNFLRNGDLNKTNELIEELAAQEVQRAESKDVEIYKKHDRFVDVKKENVIWKVADYFSQYNHIEASNYLANRYILSTAESAEQEDVLARWLVIIDFAAKSKSLHFANQLMNYAKEKFEGRSEFEDLRTKFVLANLSKELNTADKGALYQLLLEEQLKTGKAFNEQELATLESYIDQLIADKEYNTAKEVILEVQSKQPENPKWERKKVYQAKEEFYHDYYMTRIKEETVAGMRIPGYSWNGSTVECKEGDIPQEQLNKVEDRINYFRRQCNIPEIYLDQELNGWCQKAALMMEANRTLNHEPNRKWSCYSDEGAHAARYSLLTKGVNTSMSITAFMADAKNPSVGNRRWILYPNGKALGHGSTDQVAVLWALDDSGNVDSMQYTEKFIAWPPEGYVPKMMVFKYWSFSLYGDMKGAQVKVFDGEEEVPTTTHELVEGYGLPTLVWEPQINPKALTEDKVYRVQIEMANGRRYQYNVNVMDFDAVGY